MIVVFVCSINARRDTASRSVSLGYEWQLIEMSYGGWLAYTLRYKQVLNLTLYVDVDVVCRRTLSVTRLARVYSGVVTS